MKQYYQVPLLSIEIDRMRKKVYEAGERLTLEECLWITSTAFYLASKIIEQSNHINQYNPTETEQ